MRFIHISDVHLGVKPDAGRAWSEKRAQDIWDSFAAVMDVAAREQVDFLFISGDLFHAQPLKKELREVNYLFGRIPETKVVLMAGNHDYLREKSYYLTYPWAENVYFFSREEAECIDFPEQNVAVYGLSYWHREIRERLYDAVVPSDPDRINILLAHGGDERHIPFSAARLLQNGFDYIAAGHIHKSAQLVPGRAVMAGSLEPTDCNDIGPHGYWMGEFEGHVCNLQFYPIRNCEYCHEVFAVHGTTAEREVYEWAEELLRERPTYQYFRLFVEGYADPDAGFDFSRLAKMDRIVDVSMNLMPDYDYEKLAKEHQDSLLGRYIGRMQGRQDVLGAKALEFGVNALLGHKICR